MDSSKLTRRYGYKGGKTGRKHVPEETYQQIFELIRQYKRGEKVDWGLAFEQHPELGKEIGYNGPKHSRAMSFLNRARDRFKQGRTENRLPESVPVPVHVNGTAPVAAAPAPEPEPLPFNYCPKCGTNLLMFMTALRIAAKHSRRGE